MRKAKVTTKKNSLQGEIEARMKEFEKAFQAQFSDLSTNLKSEMDKNISSALGAALSGVLGSVLSGQKIDPRNLANSVAKEFVPQITDFFNKSSSQVGEGLAGLLSSAQRNF